MNDNPLSIPLNERQLFLDDHAVKETVNLDRVMHSPVKRADELHKELARQRIAEWFEDPIRTSPSTATIAVFTTCNLPAAAIYGTGNVWEIDNRLSIAHPSTAVLTTFHR